MDQYLWAIVTAGIWGVVPILEKLGLQNVKPITGLFYRCFGVIIGIVLLSIFFVKPNEVKAVDGKSIALLVTGGFLASFLAQICFYNGLKMGEVSNKGCSNFGKLSINNFCSLDFIPG